MKRRTSSQGTVCQILMFVLCAVLVLPVSRAFAVQESCASLFRAGLRQLQPPHSSHPVRINTQKLIVLDDPFDFEVMRDDSPRDTEFNLHQAIYSEGIQWGSNNRYAAVRGKSPETLILDLQSKARQSVPRFGRLSVEGDLYIAEVARGELELLDIPRQTKRQLRGDLLNEKSSFTNSFVMTRLQSGREIEYLFYDLTDEKSQPINLGNQIVISTDQAFVASQKQGQLKIFDTRTLTFIELPKDLLSDFDVSYPVETSAGVLELSLKSLSHDRRMQVHQPGQFFLSLNDLRIHRLDNRMDDSTFQWKPIPRTGLVLGVSSPNKQMVIRSLQSGGLLKVRSFGQPKVQRIGQELWILINDQFLRIDEQNGEGQILPLPATAGVFVHHDGFVGQDGVTELHLQNPRTRAKVYIPKSYKPFQLMLSERHQQVFAVEKKPDDALIFNQYSFSGVPVKAQKTEYVSLSPFGRHFAIEVDGRLEIHELAP